MKYLHLLLFSLFLYSCQPKTTQKTKVVANNNLQYAKGFTYTKYKNHISITVLKPFKGATTPLEYIITKGDTVIEPKNKHQIVIKTPILKTIATSTTQIPVFEALASEHLIKGYPNTPFISSPKTRKLIDNGSIVDVGHEQNINTEIILNINPDVMFAFAVNHLNKNHMTLQKAGIPIVVDASWLEESPLGRAEWIKFFALFLDKEEEANYVFKNIVKDYKSALHFVTATQNKPKILYGSMYGGIWYCPAGESYISKILTDAKTNYLWKNTPGTGSLSLQFEEVFIKAQKVDYWFSPGLSKTKMALKNNNKHYTQFLPYQKNKIYTYANTTGVTGGLLFFELGALRPDLILKDIIKICHPDVLATYESTFFKQLQ